MCKIPKHEIGTLLYFPVNKLKVERLEELENDEIETLWLETLWLESEDFQAKSLRSLLKCLSRHWVYYIFEIFEYS